MPNLSQPIYGAPIVSRETRSEAHNCALCIAYRDLYIIYIYICLLSIAKPVMSLSEIVFVQVIAYLRDIMGVSFSACLADL